MKKLLSIAVLVLVANFGFAQEYYEDLKHPAKLSKEQIAGTIFDDSRVDKYKDENGNKVISFSSLQTSDKHVAVGMYSAGASKEVFKEEYGVDEMMYFITGGVTLTSEDGTVTEVHAGEYVSLAKEWKGIWETDGYTKIWVIYSRDGDALE